MPLLRIWLLMGEKCLPQMGHCIDSGMFVPP